MKNNPAFLIATLFLSLCFTQAEARKKPQPKTPPTKVNTYTYTDRHFSYSLPLEWTVQNGYQRIIYQAYDRENYSLYFAAGAEAAHFEECRPELQQIINSIQFGDLPELSPKTGR